MASAPSDPRPVLGRLDASGHLIAADAELQALQQDAGSALGQPLALPQIAAVAQLARRLGTPVSRPALAASADEDFELWVTATPEGDEIALVLDGWAARPAPGPRLASMVGGDSQGNGAEAVIEWAADEELRIISLSPDLAELLGIGPAEAAGQPLTRLVHLDEDDDGEMPLISALSARRGFSGQRARSRRNEERELVLEGQVVTSAAGDFAGFRGTASANAPMSAASPMSANAPASLFDDALAEVLRSPLDRIIDSAERIVERADGPLRSDYASYGNDIAAAARHLLSVVRGMNADAVQAPVAIDLAALSAEAVVMLESSAEEHGIAIELAPIASLQAKGEERGAIQILVNLVGNAIHHSPSGGSVRLDFAKSPGFASVTVIDQGAGIAQADQQRIFERFERAHPRKGGTGLGLAIARRLARSMGGDVTLDSAPGEGARFTLTLPGN
ncbi:MAG: HAMP domain-containing sensor histidine kinase [Sphingomicrobium sp.]